MRIPRFPKGPTGEQIKNVMWNERRIGVVVVKPDAALFKQIDVERDWLVALDRALKIALKQKGYYTVVDTASQKQRLQELAFANRDLTIEQQTIGHELTADGLIIVRMTALPRRDCNIELVTDLAAATTRIERDKKATGVLSLTLFVQGSLVNLESGQSTTYQFSDPFKLHSKVGNTECPATSDAFPRALDAAANRLADNLSPTMFTWRIPPLEERVDDVAEDKKKIVEKRLREGNIWAEDGDLDMALQQWQKALDVSGGSSASALWNIAVFKWYADDLDAAEKLFRKAFQSGGTEWATTRERHLWADFQKEKESKAAAD